MSWGIAQRPYDYPGPTCDQEVGAPQSPPSAGGPIHPKGMAGFEHRSFRANILCSYHSPNRPAHWHG